MQNLIATTFEVVHYIALQAVHYKPLQEVHLSRYNQIVASLKSVPLESGTVHLEELQRLLGNVLGHFRSPRALRSPPERRFSPKTFPKPPLRKVAEGY